VVRCHCFLYGLGITAVVCVRLDVQLDKMRSLALRLVAIRAEASRPIIRATTGFDADEHRGQLGDTGSQVMPGQALARHDVAPVIHPHRVQHALCDIDPQDMHLVLHGTRLLWLYGFTALELIMAHCRRSAQRRSPLITTEHYPGGLLAARTPVVRGGSCARPATCARPSGAVRGRGVGGGTSATPPPTGS